jgi:hypothetical protein
MALQGINLPLAFTGQEAIWQKVFKVVWRAPIILKCFLKIRNLLLLHDSTSPLSLVLSA